MRNRGRFIVLLDFITLVTLNLAFLAFSMASIDPRLDIYPFYDFIGIESYQITFILIITCSLLLNAGLYKRNLLLFFLGFAVQLVTVLNEVVNRTYYIPTFISLTQDPELYHTIYGNLPSSFYLAPAYEYVNELAFFCFVVGSICLMARFYFRIGVLKSVLYTTLVCSGLLSYLEYMTVYQNLAESFNVIANGKISNFSKSWYLIGTLTNVQFLWIAISVFAGASAISVLLFALRTVNKKPCDTLRTTAAS